MWNKTTTDFEKLRYVLLPGFGNEQAIVNIQEAEHCVTAGLSPLIAPVVGTTTCNATRLLLNHPVSVLPFRKELASFFSRGQDEVATKKIHDYLLDIGHDATATTIAKLRKGKPVFDVFIDHSRMQD